VGGALADGGMDGLSRTPSGKAQSLRSLLVDMIGEYAPHRAKLTSSVKRWTAEWARTLQGSPTRTNLPRSQTLCPQP
jgi:hypothetical protein